MDGRTAWHGRWALATLIILLAPALAGVCGHGLVRSPVNAAGEPTALDTDLLACSRTSHANIAAYIKEVRETFARFERFYRVLYADLELAQNGFAAHCAVCEGALAETGAAGFGVATLGTTSTSGAARTRPVGCAAAASSCPNDAFCIDRYRSPTGVHGCALKLADLRDACLLSEGPGLEPCVAAGRLSKVLAFMHENVLRRYPEIQERLYALQEQVEKGAQDGIIDSASAQRATAEVMAVLDLVDSTRQPVGGMDISEYQEVLVEHIRMLASPGLRDDVTSHQYSRSATMVHLEIDLPAVHQFCLDQGIDDCQDVIDRTTSCCAGFGVEGCPGTSDGAGGTARAQSAFCTALRLCKEVTYGRQVKDANIDPWSDNLLRLLDVIAGAAQNDLFVNETGCLASTALEPPPPDPCEEHCRACYSTRRYHCHPQTGTCVCEVGVEWRRTLRECTPTPDPAVEACCRRLFPGEAAGRVVSSGDGSGSCNLAELVGVTYDRCQGVSSTTDWCCRLGFRVVAVDAACLEGAPSCATACAEVTGGDRELLIQCVEACSAVDVSCQRACLDLDAGEWQGCCEDCITIPASALACTVACRGRADPLLCSRLCQVKAPLVEASADLLMGGMTAERLIIGEEISASVRLWNQGLWPFVGRTEFILQVLSDCRCGMCPLGRSCECKCKEQPTQVLANIPVGAVQPRTSSTYVSAPLALDPSLSGSYLRVVATVRDRAGSMLAQAKGPIRAYRPAPEAVVLGGRFLADGKPVRKAYPGMEVVGQIDLTTRVAPADVTLAATIPGGLGTGIQTHALRSTQDRLSLTTSAVKVRPEWAGSLLGLSVDVRTQGRQLISGPLAIHSDAQQACSGPSLTTACMEIADGGGSLPDAYLEVALPRLEVVEARFVLGEDTVVLAAPGAMARAEVVLRNRETIRFGGDVQVMVVGEEQFGSPSTEAALATGGGRVAALKTGERTIPLLSGPFRVADGRSYLIHVRARDLSGTTWMDDVVEAVLFPQARLAGGLDETAGERADILQDIDVGGCSLTVRCRGCSPSCVLRVDTDACRVNLRDCSCPCQVIRAGEGAA